MLAFVLMKLTARYAEKFNKLQRESSLTGALLQYVVKYEHVTVQNSVVTTKMKSG
jgi:hypothetical protein